VFGIPRPIWGDDFGALAMAEILEVLHGTMIACEPSMMFVAWMTWRASGAVVSAPDFDDARAAGA